MTLLARGESDILAIPQTSSLPPQVLRFVCGGKQKHGGNKETSQRLGSPSFPRPPPEQYTPTVHHHSSPYSPPPQSTPQLTPTVHPHSPPHTHLLLTGTDGKFALEAFPMNSPPEREAVVTQGHACCTCPCKWPQIRHFRFSSSTRFSSAARVSARTWLLLQVAKVIRD